MEPAVELISVGKQYRKNMRSFRSIIGYIFHRPSVDNFWALDNVTLHVYPGETLGIIGPNGAGKSTLLKILANVTRPTCGTINRHGNIGALIEIGAGLHPELTGRENIFLYGAILGMRKKEIASKFEAIIEFSGLHKFLNTPVKFYSAGMYLRLGFAVTIHTDPEILLVDEVLAVGDETFQIKCLEKINEFKKCGKTIIIVSHNLLLVENICHRTAWMDHGKIQYLGPSAAAVGYYQRSVEQRRTDTKTTEQIFHVGSKHHTTGQARIVSAYVQDAQGITKTDIWEDEPCTIAIKVHFLELLENPVFGLFIKDERNNVVVSINTFALGTNTGQFAKGEKNIVTYHLGRTLPYGHYSVTPTIANSNMSKYHDWRENFLSLLVKKKYDKSVLHGNHKISIASC